MIVALATPSFLPITFGTTQGGFSEVPQPTALQASNLPPVATLPLNEPTGSTPVRIACLSCATVYDGCAAFTSAATPVTWGVAIDVPLIVL